MKTSLDRLLKYVRLNTQSSRKSELHPSTPDQKKFAESLVQELENIGLQNVRMTEQSYVYGELPATPGYENIPSIGFISHIDTSDEASGTGVNPKIVNYQGGCIPLGNSGKVLDPEIFPDMKRMIGDTLVTTDGTTLLGADDKAGIAEIVTAFERIITGNIPHGRLCTGFTPDEEIGQGALFFDISGFGCTYAYTVDGGAPSAIGYQNFNAAMASFHINGRSTHPGTAKNVMINAAGIAAEIQSMLPPNEVPEHTENLEGFYHLIEISGTVSSAESVYIIRDFDPKSFEYRIATVKKIADEMNRKYGAGSVVLSVKEQYRNMEEIIRRYPFLIEIAENAITQTGLTPVSLPIRGGTDGALLSFQGLPCLNLGTGGYNFHGESEYVSVREMEISVKIILNIVREFCARFSNNDRQKS